MDIPLPFTDNEIVLRQRYELVSILNDLLVAVWFIVGSILFFSPSTTEAGTWLFPGRQRAAGGALRVRVS